MEYCKCEKFKEEVKLGIAIIYSGRYKSYYIQDIETDGRSYQRQGCKHGCLDYNINNIRINFCPWCGGKLTSQSPAG